MHTAVDETTAAAPERVLTTEVDAATDLSHAGVLTVDELAEHAFRYGEHDPANPGLQPGKQIGVLEDHALVYGHVPGEQAILAAATHVWEYFDPIGEPDAFATLVADPPTWAIFHRHDLACTAGGNPSECGCAPPDDPNSLWVTGATEDTPGAVPVTPVYRPSDGYAPLDAVVSEQVDEWLAHPDLRQMLADEGPAEAAAYMVSLLGSSGRSQYALLRMAAHLLVRQMQADSGRE